MQVALLVALTTLPAAPLESGTELEFQGRFVAEKGDPAVTQKDFRLSCLVVRGSQPGATIYWTLGEQGRGQWSWLDRFGKLDVNPKWRADSSLLPALLYQRPAGTSIVPVMLPFFAADEPLRSDASWVQDRLDYRVTGDARVAGRTGWHVDVRNAYGHQRTLVIDKESPLLLAATSTVFIGQGEEHELSLQLVRRGQLSAEKSAAVQRGFEALLTLRGQLEHEPRTREFQWTAERLATLRGKLPKAAEQAVGEPLLTIAQAAREDARRQANRSGALKAVRKQVVGQLAPKPPLTELDGAKFDWKQVAGRVTVLHFWTYRDSPLEEPYGQVAYVDFLRRQREKDKVTVLGVAVNELLEDPASFRRGAQSAKKLRTFMNLSYPVLLDSGAAIQAFGDPRITGAKLPLVVVIDPQGKVVHYHVGLYKFDRDRGLAELDDVVTQALKTAP